MRTLIRGFGEVLITLGLVLLLFAGYQLWWTNVRSQAATARNTERIIESWQAAPTAPTTPPAPPPVGDGIALMTIPRLGEDVADEPVLQGVSLEVLAQGLGHYPNSAMPGDTGNFAVAGHRATNGEPLRNIDQLQNGDFVYVQTQDSWFVYRLFRDQIVTPNDDWVVTPTPFPAEPAISKNLLTITTCHPRWGSTERWIWWGELVSATPKSAGTPDLVVSG